MSGESTFGGWLRRRRNELGITQEELSNQLGFSLALLRKLESSERRPSGQIVTLLAEYFHIPADERDAFITFARIGGIESIIADELTPGTSASPWRRAYLHQTNLPAMLTPMIGRQRELALAMGYLRQPKTRLLTLTGTPGIGKTRIALEVAANLVETFEDGVFLVDLTSVIDPDLVIPTIAQTLGLNETRKGLFEIVLLDYIRERRMLLFLDNFEQVLDAATSITRLLEASPWLKVIVTSREALQVRGERRFNIPPLAVPDIKEFESLETLEAYPSLELFLERARAVMADFELNRENAGEVAAICIKLEGVPLAIELAAARIRHFSPKELYSGLDSRLTLLTGGARDLPTRHRTLRSAIEWSYDLLNENEQRLFRFAGIFAGGITDEALGWLGKKQPDSTGLIFDTLLALNEKNLILTENKVANSGAVRFRLLESIREFAVEQLEKHGEITEARSGHADYYLELAERAEQHFTGTQYPGWGADQIAWVNRQKADFDNMRLGLDWYQLQVEVAARDKAVSLLNLQKGLKLATALRRVWFERGHFTEGVQWLMSFLSKVPKPLPTNLPELRAIYAKAIAIVGRLSPVNETLGAVPPLLEESLSIATELGDKQLIALVLLISGVVALKQANYEKAYSFQKECLKLYRELGNQWGAAAVLQEIGISNLKQGNISLARPILEESLQLFRGVGEHVGVSSVLNNLAHIAYYQKKYGEARTFWQESQQWGRDSGYSNMLGYIEIMLGWVALRESNREEASELFKKGLQLGQTIRSVETIYSGLGGLGVLAHAQHHTEKATFLFGAADTLGMAANILLFPLKKAELDLEIAMARAQLSDEKWNEVWVRGYEMAFEVTKLMEDEPLKLDKALVSLLEVAWQV